MDEIVNNNSQFKCNKCCKCYSGYQSLWIHNKKFHDLIDNKMTTLNETNNSSIIDKVIVTNNSLICKYCKKIFSSKSSLCNHNKKFHNNMKGVVFVDLPCLNKKICKQTIENISLICKYCKKIFSHRNSRWKHEKSCKGKNGLIVVKETEIFDLKNTVEKLQKENKDLIPKTNYPINNHLIDIIVDKSKIIEELKTNESNNIYSSYNNIKENDVHSIALCSSDSPELENKDKKLIEELYREIKLKNQEIKLKDQKIKLLEDMYIKKQNRKDYPDKNVIYIVTTEDNKKKRIYIIGKAINLKNRLSIYNKTAEHEVIYYKSCKKEEMMNIVECMVLNKLKDYKEKANRDRFILPIEKDISFFTNIIDNCINFL